MFNFTCPVYAPGNVELSLKHVKIILITLLSQTSPTLPLSLLLVTLTNPRSPSKPHPHVLKSSILYLRECCSVLQASSIMLTSMSMALTRITLPHTTSVHSLGRCHRHTHMTRPHFQVINASLEARVQWQVMRQCREVGHRMSAQIQHRGHFHLLLAARCIPRHIDTIIHRQPRLSADPSHVNPVLPSAHRIVIVVRVCVRVLHWFRRKNPSRSTAHVPRQHHVALDKADGQMVRLIVVIARLTDERKQGDLVQSARDNAEAQLQFVFHGYRHRVRHIRGHAKDTARECGLRNFQV